MKKIVLVIVFLQLFAISGISETNGTSKDAFQEAKSLCKGKEYSTANQAFLDLIEIERSKQNPNLKKVASYYSWYSWCLAKNRQYDDAINARVIALKLYKKLSRRTSVAKAYNAIGGLYKKKGDYQKALNNYIDGLNFVIAKKFSATLQINIGHTYLQKGWMDIAKSYYLKALKSAEKFSDEKSKRIIFNNLGVVSEYLGKYEESLEYHQKSLMLGKKLDLQSGLAVTYSNLGSLSNSLGKPEKALEYHEQALEINKMLKNESRIALGLNNIGYTYYNLSKFSKAIDLYREAMTINQKLGNRSRLASNHLNLGAVYSVRGEYDKALEHYQLSLKISKSLDRQAQVAISLNNIGTIYGYQNYHKKAEEFYRKSYEINYKINNQENLANNLNNIGKTYQDRGIYHEAEPLYLKALNISQKIGNKKRIIESHSQLGSLYLVLDQFKKATKHFEICLLLANEIKDTAEISNTYNSLGVIEFNQSHYPQAIEYFNQALSIDEATGSKWRVDTTLMNIGLVYKNWGKFDEALSYFQKSLDLSLKQKDRSGASDAFNGIGQLYQEWGDYKKAMDFMQKSLKVEQQINSKRGIARSLNSIGGFYSDIGKKDKALDFFNQAKVINQSIGHQSELAINLNNIANIYQDRKQLERAIAYYNKSIQIQKELGNEREVATSLNGLGLAYNSLKQYKKALKNYKTALAISKRLETDAQRIFILHNIGVVYYNLEKYGQAIRYFRDSISQIESTRLTAAGNLKREYLAKKLLTYQLLISAHIRKGDIPQAFHSIEASRAKLLAETMSQESQVLPIQTLEQTKLQLSPEQLVIQFSNINRNQFAQIIYSRSISNGLEVSKSDFLNGFPKSLFEQIDEISAKSRGISLTKKINDDFEIEKSKFEKIIYYYRYLLRSKKNSDDREDLSRRLYNLLIEPIASNLKGKKDLLIMPDGVLGFIPFETLKDKSGHYLGEQYNIHYMQSQTVLNLVKSRNYSDNRKPILALGGAIYSKVNSKQQISSIDTHFESIRKNVITAVRFDRSLNHVYDSMDMSNWSVLPGTVKEIKGIASLINNAELLVGKDVTEENIKKLSFNQELNKYKILHFATHSFVVPEIPELSAIVLSQTKNGDQKEDGYLTAGEINKLDINADFVNLSACDTGLGRLYGGEGVVGLTQSFLIAGANSLAVSLWKVDDKATAEFMIHFYKYFVENSMNFHQALANTKKDFIQGKFGKHYQDPYYWAPFVFYGKYY